MIPIPLEAKASPHRALSERKRQPAERVPLVVHVLYRLDFGGLENGVVNLINRMPEGQFRHAIVCLTHATDFRQRLTRTDVSIYELDKRDGKDLFVYWRLWKLLRRLRPDLIHTRNLPTLDCQPVAWLAGVPSRVHGEHGWDVIDLTGKNWKYQLLRRWVQPFVQRYVPLSIHIANWLTNDVRVPASKIRRICNGVDSDRFFPARGGREPLPVQGFESGELIVIGTVGRMEAVKDPMNLVEAFVLMQRMLPDAWRDRVRLVMVGDGRLMSAVADRVATSGVSSRVWLAGARNDTPALMRGFDIFALPSIAEGISNTILEAMASGLPVVATNVGGNSELVVEGETGRLVRSGDPAALGEALARLVTDPAARRRQGQLGRERIEREFSIGGMVTKYANVYDELVARPKAEMVGR